MKDFSALMREEYNTQREHWEKALQAELKLDDISGKTSKKHLDLGPWPTLSTKARHVQELPSKTAWKKAVQTYVQADSNSIVNLIQEDLEAGVRVFFFHSTLLALPVWELIERTILNFTDASEVEVFLLGESSLPMNNKLKVISHQQLITAAEVAGVGGHNVQELALLTVKLIESLEAVPSHLGVYLDSHFFKNIAKLRAMKLLVQKVFAEAQLRNDLKIVALNSYREWTLYERYSNMLRNDVQVASGLIGGADVVQSSGYQTLFELETNETISEHTERSLRMARNTSHILSLESMLGVVEDAAFGSFHLENLTHEYAEAAWKMMQLLLKLSHDERRTYLAAEAEKVKDVRLERVKTRKDVLAGMNDFPNGAEILGVTLKAPTFFRVSRPFEELRLRVERLKSKPRVHIHLQGDYGNLNNRINFIKNYFELIGLEVMEPSGGPSQSTDILVLCAKDEDYAGLSQQLEARDAYMKFVAGKVDLPNYQSIYSGQNVYGVLEQLVQKMEGAK